VNPQHQPALTAEGDRTLAPSSELATAVSLLSAATLASPEAESHRAWILEFVDHHDDAALRTCPEAHLTGSALVVDAQARHTLVLHHRKLGRWFQPGGHADGDTNLAGVALREAAEETGIVGLRLLPEVIDVDVHRVEPPTEEPHLHLDVRFVVFAPPGAEATGNHESLGLRWVTVEQLDDLDPPVDSSTHRLVELGLSRARAYLSDQSST